MLEKPMYHDGMRYYQDRFDTRQLADRLEQVRHDTAFNEGHRKIIERSTFFFLATTDAEGWPDCSYKGGLPGFVRAERVFPNCPRYIHTMELMEHSKYSPKRDQVPPVPEWKVQPDIKDSLPPGDPARDAETEHR